MRISIAFMLFLSLSLSVFAQGGFKNISKLKPSKDDFENIHVDKMYTAPKASSFVIWVKKEVKLHKHIAHAEHVYVLKGKGMMQLGGKKFEIKKGDLIFIPANTPHAVKTTGGTLKVLSVQAPEFKGKDRIMLN